MKNRIGVLGLVILCLGLGVALVAVKKQASDQQRQDSDLIGTFSNKWDRTSRDLDEQRQVASMYEKDLSAQKKALQDLTNNFSSVSANLSQASANLAKTEASLKAAEEEVKKRDAKIAALENQNQALDKQALDLSAAITNLTVQIAETQRKLAASEGDKAFLEKELKRLMSEKAELERQFNDLTVLRAQVAKLKEELSIERRIEWIRRGLFAATEEKGAQKLLGGLIPQPAAAKPPRPNFDLNVEVGSDGSVKVVPPRTNAPPAATTNAPPR